MPYLIGFLAAFLFGLNGTVLKVVLTADLTPAQVTFIRAMVTLSLAAIVLLFTNRSGFRLTKQQFFLSLGVGLIGVAAVQWLFASSIKLIPVGISLLVEYSAVIVVALFARFVYRERVLLRIWFAIALVVFGLAIVAEIWATTINTTGIVLAAISALCYAAYFLIGEKALKVMTTMAMTFWSMVWAAIFWGIFGNIPAVDLGIFTQGISMEGNLTGLELPLWVPVLWATVVGSFFTTALSYMAINRLKATSAGIIASSEVIVAFVVAWLWLNESLSTLQVIGSLIVVVGISVAQTARKGATLDLVVATLIPEQARKAN